MDDNEILGSESEQGTGTPSFGGGAGRAIGRAGGKLIQHGIKHEATQISQSADTDGDGSFLDSIGDFISGIFEGIFSNDDY